MTGKDRPPDSARAARAATRTLDILERVDRQSLSVSAATMVVACGISRSTLRDLLRMLQARGYLVYRAAEKGWAPGQRLLGSRGGSLEFKRGIAVLELFGAGGGGLSIEDIVVRSGLSRELVGRVLTALAAFGVVVPSSDGTYALGAAAAGGSSVP